MSEVLEKLFKAADNHGEDAGEADHTVGDLQDLLRTAWELMTPSQKLAFLSEERSAELVVEAGARGEFSLKDLADEVRADVARMELVVTGKGYVFLEGEYGFSWENAAKDSGYFRTREDAIADAYEEATARIPF